MAQPTTERRRAAPLPAEERRQAILDAVVPLLLAEGAAVTTRQIAQAAGIAEGTIFRVFPDKAALLMAAVERLLEPPDTAAGLSPALDGAVGLRERVLVMARRISARSDQLMPVLVALRQVQMAQSAGLEPGQRPARDPAEVFGKAEQALHARLTAVFAAHRDELRVAPATAATALRSLLLGSRHPGADPATRLTPEQVTDLLLDGVRREVTTC